MAYFLRHLQTLRANNSRILRNKHTNQWGDFQICISVPLIKIQKLEYFENGTQLFYETQEILNLCIRWPILRCYRFVVEVTFKTC